MAERNIKDFFEELKLQDDFFIRLADFVQAGNTTLQQSRTIETMIVDDSWVLTIESLIYSVEQIVKNPKKFIIDIYNVVNIERVKKTDANTVRHLAQHTGNIRTIEDDGTIKPAKLLNKEMDEDLFIYENRFVATLINNLTYFIEQRYNAIKNNIDTFDITSLKMKSEFNLKKGSVEYEMNLKVKNEPTNSVILQKNHELLNKVENIRKRLKIIKTSAFCRDMEKIKPVIPPIMKTNILRMHTDYSNCYKLWMFISAYDTIGYSVEVSDKSLPVDTDYYEDLTMLIAVSLKTMIDNNALRRLTYRKTAFRRRKKRNYKVLREVDYVPHHRNITGFDDKDVINQYYFDKVRDMLMKKDELKANELKDKVTVKATFSTFFRSLTAFSNEMYNEVMGISAIPGTLKKQTSLQKKYQEYLKQEELYKKYKLLSQLKTSELQKTLIRENTQKIKLERLKFDYEFAFDKANNKKSKKKKPKTQTAKTTLAESAKLSEIYRRAEEDEKERMLKERDREEKIRLKELERLRRLEEAREKQKRIREKAKEILMEEELNAKKYSKYYNDDSDKENPNKE